jgi:hypothetical protein
MKTLTEYEAEMRQASLGWDEQRRRLRQQLLQQLAEHCDPPVYQPPPPPPVVVGDFTQIRTELRQALADGYVDVLDVVCDHCQTPLVDRHPGSITASDPPYRSVGCVGCGWLGHMRVV